MSNIETGGPAFPTEVWDAEGIPQHTEGMTLRQYAAIKLSVPSSGDEWLDDMIRTSLRDELAAKAMQGLMADPNTITDEDNIASVCYRIARGMMKLRDR